MPAKIVDQPSEFEAALLLPDDQNARMLHAYAEDYGRRHGGADFEDLLRSARLMRERYERDLPLVGTEGFRPFVGTREAARMCVLTESVTAKLAVLRNRAYRFARAKLFHDHGVLVEFPRYPEPGTMTAPASTAPAKPATLEPAAEETATAAAGTQTPEPGARLVTKREVKSTLLRLRDHGLSGAELQAFKQRCLRGDVTLEQMQQWAANLTQARAGGVGNGRLQVVGGR